VDNSGYHAIRNERTKLDLLAGLDVSREFFEGNDNDRTSLEAQLGQTLDHRLTPRLSLTEQLFFFPNLSNGGDYRINFDAGLVADVTRRIAWQVTLSDRYLSNPPGGAKQRPSPHDRFEGQARGYQVTRPVQITSRVHPHVVTKSQHS
jgi:putative salt-induced outer membrane protein